MAQSEHQIQIQTSDIQFTLEARKRESILETTQRTHHKTPNACRAGTCEICQATLLQGSVFNRKTHTILKANTNQPITVLCCQCEPVSDITLHMSDILKPGEWPIHTVAAQIIENTPLNQDVNRVMLRLPAGKSIGYHAGQYLEIKIGDKQCPFSIANAPPQDPDKAREIELHIRFMDDSDDLQQLKVMLEKQSTLEITLPMGDCVYQENDASALLFLGGSTGFAPLKALIEDCFQRGVAKPMYFYFGARQASDLYLPELPEQWARDHANFTYVPVLSEPKGDWQGRKGLVHKAVMEDFKDISSMDIYAGGSPAMVYAAFDAFPEIGLNPERMYSDVFAYAPRG